MKPSKGADLFNLKLPDELITEIFVKLGSSKSSCDACSLVCRRWRRLDRASRRSLRIGTFGGVDAILKLLLVRFTALQSVSIDCRPPDRRTPPSKRWRAIITFSEKHLPGGAGYDNSTFQNQSRSFTDAGLSCLVSSCLQLEKLSLIWCPQISYLGLISVAETCKMLKTLDLQNLVDMALVGLAKGCPQLKEIVLSHCPQITDAGLTHLVKGCTRLETFHLNDCALVTDSGVATVVSQCTNIKKVVIERSKVSKRTI